MGRSAARRVRRGVKQLVDGRDSGPAVSQRGWVNDEPDPGGPSRNKNCSRHLQQNRTHERAAVTERRDTDLNVSRPAPNGRLRDETNISSSPRPAMNGTRTMSGMPYNITSWRSTLSGDV